MWISAEPGIVIGVPLHGSTFTVAALLFRPPGDADRISHLLLGGGNYSGHFDFIAVIHQGRVACHEQNRCQHLVYGSVVYAFAVAESCARVIVIVEHKQWLAAVNFRLLIQPVALLVPHRRRKCRVVPIHVRLLNVEEVIVVLVSCRGEWTSRMTGGVERVVARLTRAVAIVTDVPISVMIASRAG